MTKKHTAEWVYLQHIADHPNRPHVGGKPNGLVVDHLRRDELWGAKEDSARVIRIKTSCEAEVYEFYLMRGFAHTQDVLRLSEERRRC